MSETMEVTFKILSVSLINLCDKMQRYTTNDKVSPFIEILMDNTIATVQTILNNINEIEDLIESEYRQGFKSRGFSISVEYLLRYKNLYSEKIERCSNYVTQFKERAKIVRQELETPLYHNGQPYYPFKNDHQDKILYREGDWFNLMDAAADRVLDIVFYYFPEYKEQNKPEQRRLPEELNTDEAKAILNKTITAKLCDDTYKWFKSKALLAYFSDKASEYLGLCKGEYDGKPKTSWKPFETLFGVSGLSGAKRDYQKTGTLPDGYSDVDKLFE